ncbi:hypothetical protein MXD60_14700, partial [Frankia sp. AgB32]|nr:hypothetical protein [Frankia sp. AgB32]
MQHRPDSQGPDRGVGAGAPPAPAGGPGPGGRGTGGAARRLGTALVAAHGEPLPTPSGGLT